MEKTTVGPESYPVGPPTQSLSSDVPSSYLVGIICDKCLGLHTFVIKSLWPHNTQRQLCSYPRTHCLNLYNEQTILRILSIGKSLMESLNS